MTRDDIMGCGGFVLISLGVLGFALGNIAQSIRLDDLTERIEALEELADKHLNR